MNFSSSMHLQTNSSLKTTLSAHGSCFILFLISFQDVSESIRLLFPLPRPASINTETCMIDAPANAAALTISSISKALTAVAVTPTAQGAPSSLQREIVSIVL